jgi:hypothetical protein
MTSFKGLTSGHDERGKFPEILHEMVDLPGWEISTRQVVLWGLLNGDLP